MEKHVNDLPSFAEQFRWLHERIRGADGQQYPDGAIAAATAEFGVPLSKAAIAKLRKGETPNPGRDTIRAVAHAFGVSAGFFVDPEIADRIKRGFTDGTTADLQPAEPPSNTAREQHDGGVLLRGFGGLSKDSRDLLQQVVSHFHQLDVQRGEGGTDGDAPRP
ncbi:hypothetical protein NLX83_13865 [Allokutzneria sp. A3M-2-11 16]|uniref:hypothetical protein n=1 Tax=Allokutzneria sp. A3M-2-11 16 TaxID=2962043 RepID=UPI0020B7AEB9|nr:hypothetical protein [Allokutzneria sp. A3M-2-11 16]MCP3800346.1 hypothetical protein [Allokutzneria sp. A3M-2-11 16]